MGWRTLPDRDMLQRGGRVLTELLREEVHSLLAEEQMKPLSLLELLPCCCRANSHKFRGAKLTDRTLLVLSLLTMK